MNVIHNNGAMWTYPGKNEMLSDMKSISIPKVFEMRNFQCWRQARGQSKNVLVLDIEDSKILFFKKFVSTMLELHFRYSC